MPLQKQNINVNFAQGLDTKSDPRQLEIGKFLELENMVFTTAKQLSKRDGFPLLPPLPDSTSTNLTTFNNNLTAIGENFNVYNRGSMTWTSKSDFFPVSLKNLSLYRSSTNQIQCDSAVASNGLVCATFIDKIDGSTLQYKYLIADSITGQNIVAPTTLVGCVGQARVSLLGNYFVIVYPRSSSAICYIAIRLNNVTSVSARTDLTTTYLSAGNQNAFDTYVANNNLYLSYNASDGGGAIRTLYMDSTLVQHTGVVIAGKSATLVSVTADITTSTPVIYVSFWVAGGGYTAGYNQNLTVIFAAQQIINGGTMLNLISAAQDGSVRVAYEFDNNYSYDAAVPTHFLNARSVSQAGVVAAAFEVVRSVGIASKAFAIDGKFYFLAAYQSPFQPSYFLLDFTSSLSQVVGKLAASNGFGYQTKGIPSVSVIDSVVYISYLRKDFEQPVSKANGGTNVAAGIYTQTGIDLASWNFDPTLSFAETGKNLQASGGFVWAFDGYTLSEQGFFLYPDSVELTGSAIGGTMTAQAYYYAVTYEWMDNQGNIHRSAPSIPVTVTTAGATSSVTVHIPTLRLTYKSSVKIVVYRWSTAQQVYYQATTLTAPILNDKTADSVDFVDTQPDSAILGNAILYTTGGVLENIQAPATDVLALYKSRLVLVDAEDENLLWYSKPVIEGTPVEMTDLQTLYVSPTIGVQGNTGGVKGLAQMDDKLITFKANAINYLVGQGPDITGANNDFSDPIYITSTVGSANQPSIVLIPQGLMFQSNKGIWLLDRSLNTKYVGAPVEAYNDSLVLSSLTIPGTNEVRFTLDTGETLVYDYFYDQWDVFKGAPGISSTIYEDKHTLIDSYGRVLQQTPNTYIDGSRPVLIRFKTGWLNFAGLQGFERAYFFYLMGTYFSPHKLKVEVAFDFNPDPVQTTYITPDNYSGTYGTDPLYGASSAYGGSTNLENWRIFFKRQKCETFQITVTEIFDPSFGTVAGEGLSLSGMNIVYGLKSGYPRLSKAHTAG